MPYALACFLGSILMFSLEPLLGKALTPRFGGSAGVWVTCMLFFQATLLLGYLWAHGLSRLLPPRRQVAVHGTLLGTTCLLLAWQGLDRLPFIPYWGALPSRPEGPLQLLVLLSLSAGLPMVALSATAPLLQAWFAKARPGRSPYRLYAASNVGSMAGLLCYPFLVERLLGLRAQVWVSACLFGAFFGLVLWLGRGQTGSRVPEPAPADAPGLILQGRWLLASAVGVMVLMGATNLLLFHVVAIPLLWVGPLALYLLTFVLVFEGRPFWEDPRSAFLWLALFALASLCLGVLGPKQELKWALAAHAAVLFGGLVCHGHLHRRRPGPGALTRFYLMVALGGVLGGVAVAVIAPLVYTRNYEFGQAAGLTAVVGVLALAEAPPRWRRWAWAPALAATGTGIYLAVAPLFQAGHYDRDFYGLVEVKDQNGIRFFGNGGTVHGMIRLDEPLAPLSYFAPDSGAARALQALRTRKPALRVGVIGMGIGTLGDYASPADAWTFYEISPAVNRMAGLDSPYFPVVRSMPVRPDVRLGDGRMLLELDRRAGRLNAFDLLVVDAFTGDRVPFHLLTLEALDLYLDHLAPDGILALHISNPLPLHRVCLALAKARNLYGCIHEVLATPGKPRKPLVFPAIYVLMARRPDLLRSPIITEGLQVGFGPRVFAGLVPESSVVLPLASDRPWTDERSALSDLLFNLGK